MATTIPDHATSSKLRSQRARLDPPPGPPPRWFGGLVAVACMYLLVHLLWWALRGWEVI